VHLLGTAIEEGRDRSSMSGILADTARRLRPVRRPSRVASRDVV